MFPAVLSQKPLWVEWLKLHPQLHPRVLDSACVSVTGRSIGYVQKADSAPAFAELAALARETEPGHHRLECQAVINAVMET